MGHSRKLVKGQNQKNCVVARSNPATIQTIQFSDRACLTVLVPISDVLVGNDDSMLNQRAQPLRLLFTDQVGMKNEKTTIPQPWSTLVEGVEVVVPIGMTLFTAVYLQQCDQMVKLCFNIWPSAIMKIIQEVQQISQSKLTVFQNKK